MSNHREDRLVYLARQAVSNWSDTDGEPSWEQRDWKNGGGILLLDAPAKALELLRVAQAARAYRDVRSNSSWREFIDALDKWDRADSPVPTQGEPNDR